MWPFRNKRLERLEKFVLNELINAIHTELEKKTNRIDDLEMLINEQSHRACTKGEFNELYMKVQSLNDRFKKVERENRNWKIVNRMTLFSILFPLF